MVQIKYSTCKDCGNFNIWKKSMAKLSLSLWLTWRMKAISYTWKIMSYIDTRGVTMYLTHEETKYRYLDILKAVVFWHFLTNLGL